VLAVDPAEQVVLAADPAEQVVLAADPAEQVVLAADPEEQVAQAAAEAAQVAAVEAAQIAASEAARVAAAQAALAAVPVDLAAERVSRARTQFGLYLAELYNKVLDLDQRRGRVEGDDEIKDKADDKLEEGYQAANTLYQELKLEGNAYFSNSQRNHEQFKQTCAGLITTAHKTLDKHRGWSAFLTNLGLVCAGLIGFIIKGVINISNNRSFLFVHKTDASKKLDRLEENINKLELEEKTDNLEPEEDINNVRPAP
ncbi:MAG: hypothetical protein ACHP65_03140, partial [Legionellales bacterium]